MWPRQVRSTRASMPWAAVRVYDSCEPLPACAWSTRWWTPGPGTQKTGKLFKVCKVGCTRPWLKLPSQTPAKRLLNGRVDDKPGDITLVNDVVDGPCTHTHTHTNTHTPTPTPTPTRHTPLRWGDRKSSYDCTCQSSGVADVVCGFDTFVCRPSWSGSKQNRQSAPPASRRTVHPFSGTSCPASAVACEEHGADDLDSHLWAPLLTANKALHVFAPATARRGLVALTHQVTRPWTAS